MVWAGFNNFSISHRSLRSFFFLIYYLREVVHDVAAKEAGMIETPFILAVGAALLPASAASDGETDQQRREGEQQDERNKLENVFFMLWSEFGQTTMVARSQSGSSPVLVARSALNEEDTAADVGSPASVAVPDESASTCAFRESGIVMWAVWIASFFL